MKDNGALGVEFVTATVDAIIRRGVLLVRKKGSTTPPSKRDQNPCRSDVDVQERDIEQSHHLEHCRC
jgi:hypothetical protein